MQTLANIVERLECGRPSRSLVEECLARITDPSGEGRRVFLKVHAGQAIAACDQYDRMRRKGATLAPFSGIPISIKDLFDIAGDITTAGSVVLRDAAPAAADAPSVARLRSAGFIPIGRTNMTEFAFSGLGINPHYGTPRNPYERRLGRIPGGSSSGAAVSVTDGMASAALGTDTGGSCRIPAALCGTVGFKPTASRIPLDGVMPLSPSLDSVGSLAASVACCAAVDAVLAGDPASELTDLPLQGLELAVPQTLVLDGLDASVSQAFGSALTALSQGGAHISDIPLREFTEIPQINAKGGFPAAEAYAFHRPLIADKGAVYDPRILSRILRGKEQNANDYLELKRARADFIRRLHGITTRYDALVMPTVPIVAPLLSELEKDDDYNRINLLLLRNPAIANLADRCAISIPCHRADEPPVGLTLMGEHGSDRKLLSIAGAIERIVSPLLLDGTRARSAR